MESEIHLKILESLCQPTVTQYGIHFRGGRYIYFSRYCTWCL